MKEKCLRITVVFVSNHLFSPKFMKALSFFLFKFYNGKKGVKHEI